MRNIFHSFYFLCNNKMRSRRFIQGGNIIEKMPSLSGGSILSSEKMPMIIAISVVIVIFIAVIIYISFVIKASNLQGKVLIAEPRKLDEISSPIVVDSADIPRLASGREYTYSFWVFVDKFTQQQGGIPRMIFYRGSATSIADANPIVMMDGTTNKLYMILKTQGSQLVSTDRNLVDYDANLKRITDRSYFLNKDIQLSTPNSHKHIILSIDYVPLERWVNIAFIVDNKMITIFLDGEIYSVKSVDEYKMLKPPVPDNRGNIVDYNLIIEPSGGDLYAGKYGINPVAEAYLSNLSFYNYAISLNDIKGIYRLGPFPKSWLSWFGISKYGVRNPIYKLGENSTSKI